MTEWRPAVGAEITNPSQYTFTWQTDGSVVRTGWLLCLTCGVGRGYNAGACFDCNPSCNSCADDVSCTTCAPGYVDDLDPNNPDVPDDNLCRAVPLMSSDSSVCPMVPVSAIKSCVTSSNYPAPYGAAQSCRIMPYFGWNLQFAALDIEAGFDGFKWTNNQAITPLINMSSVSNGEYFTLTSLYRSLGGTAATTPAFWWTTDLQNSANTGFRLCANCGCPTGRYLTQACTFINPVPNCAVCPAPCSACSSATVCTRCATSYFSNGPPTGLCTGCAAGCESCDNALSLIHI